MRVLSVMIVAALVGTLVGGAVAYVQVSADRNASNLPGEKVRDVFALPTDASAPRAVVDQADFNFGTMQQGRRKSHTFVFKNEGAAPLTLNVGQPTCKCTVGSVTEGPIPPGGSGTVTLEWTAITGSGPFRQSAPVTTNDPLNSNIQLTIHGEVTEAEGIEPREFAFDTIPIGESKTAEVFVMAMLQDNLTVSDPRLSELTTRDKFDVKIVPVEPADLPNSKAKSGVMVSLTAKPGLPIGRINQWLALSTNLEDGEHLEIPVSGRIVGDISVRGLGWNEEQAMLLMGSVKSSQGKQEKLNLFVRGADPENFEIKVASSDPPELSATIGEPKKLSDGLFSVPLTVEIPIGTQPMIRTDTAQGEAGRIVLTTTHPKVKELVLGVRFSVER
jgi:Protein of unknown function (DUF1573)